MCKKLKILFVTSEYPHLNEKCGGVGMYVATIGQILAKRGHEVHVLSCLDDRKRKDYTDRGIQVHARSQLRIRGLRRLNKILKIPNTLEAIRSDISNYLKYYRLGINFDVVEYPDLDAEGWIFALYHRKSIVVHLHLPVIMWYPNQEVLMNHRDINWASVLEKFAIQRADAIISPSKLMVELVRDKKWLKGKSVTIIPNSIDLSDWSDITPVMETQPVVLSLGWLGHNKAPEILVEALAIIRKRISSAKAYFVGESLESRDGLVYRDWIEKTSSDLDGCEFVGYVPHDSVKYYFSLSRILVISSWFESYSIAALEAMACGRPVIMTEKTGVAELVQKYGTGVVVPPGDPNAVADALFPFLEDSDYAAEVGERGKMLVRELHDSEKIATQHEKVYRQAIVSFNEK